MGAVVRYDIALAYIEEGNESIEELIYIESYKTMEEAMFGVSVEDAMEYYKNTRSEKEGEIKDLLIVKVEKVGEGTEKEHWVQKGMVGMGHTAGNYEYRVRDIYGLMKNDRVEIFTSNELIREIGKGGSATDGMIKLLEYMSKGDVVSAYTFKVDGHKWLSSVEEVYYELGK